MVDKRLLSLPSQDPLNGHRKSNFELLDSTVVSELSVLADLMKNKQPVQATAAETCSQCVAGTHAS